jgi:hypothetical protein
MKISRARCFRARRQPNFTVKIFSYIQKNSSTRPLEITVAAVKVFSLAPRLLPKPRGTRKRLRRQSAKKEVRQGLRGGATCGEVSHLLWFGNTSKEKE